MIDVVQELPQVGFALKPIVMQLQCKHADGSSFAAKGRTQRILFDNEYNSENDTIVIEWVEVDGTSSTLTYTLKDTPVLDTEVSTWHEYFPPQPILPYESYINLLSEELRKSTVFNLFFKSSYELVAFNSASIIIEARENVTSFQVSLTGDLLGTIPAQVPATADSTPDNYKVLYEVYGHAAQKLYSGFGFPNTEGGVRLNIADILKNFLLSKVITPPNMITLDTHIAPFKFPYHARFTEEYGTPIIRQNWQWRQNKEIIRGDVAGTPYALVMPAERKVGKTDLEFLAWHNGTNQTIQLALEIKRTIRETGQVLTDILSNQQVVVYDYELDSYEYGSYSQSTTPLIDATVLPNQTVMIPVLKWFSLDDIAFLQIRPLNLANQQPLGDFRNYYIDPYYYEEVRYLAFLNHFGVWETVRFVGNTGNSSDVKRRDAVSFRNDTVLTEQVDIKWQRTYTYRSGIMTEAESYALEHLVTSPFVCEILPNKGYIPLRLIDTKYTPDDGQKDTFRWEIKAVPTQQYDIPQNGYLTW